MFAQVFIEALRRKPPGNSVEKCLHKCFFKRSGASRPVIRRVDVNTTGRLAPIPYVFNGLLGWPVFAI